MISRDVQQTGNPSSLSSASILGITMATTATLACLLIRWTAATPRLVAFALPPLLLFSFDLLLTAIVAVATIGRRDAGYRETETPDFANDLSVLVPVLVRKTADVAAITSLLRDCAQGPFRLSVPIWLLVDLRDADDAHVADDARLIALVTQAAADATIDRARAGDAPVGILRRDRSWNPHERLWMGYERKRGKVEDALRFLRGDAHGFHVTGHHTTQDDQLAFVMDLDSRMTQHDLLALRTAFLQARRTTAPARRPALMAPAIKKITRSGEPLERWLTEPELFEHVFRRRLPTLRQDALRTDIYHGKAVVHVDDFLARCTGFDPNTILSHDHIESLFGRGQSTSLATAFEPFPATRQDWERRQHRWVRGDVQILPYLFGRRRTAPGRMTLDQWLGCCLIVLAACLPLFQFACVALGLASGLADGVTAMAVILLTAQGGIVFAPLGVLRMKTVLVPRYGVRHLILHAGSNAILQGAGMLIYMQRNFLITADAIVQAGIRMIRGRHGLLEWYPPDPDAVIRRRSVLELGAATLFASSALVGYVSAWLAAASVAWVAIPYAIEALSHRLAKDVSAQRRDAPYAVPARR